jgi:hypothetical protein
VVPLAFLERDSTSGLTGIAGYDHCTELVNTWVFVTGHHPEKGLYGRVQESLSNHKVQVEARSGARLVDIEIDYLFSP